MDKVRQLQRKLFVSAKRSPGRRFHALFDRIHRGDVLMEAWNRVRANGGAPGVDKQSLEAIEEQGVAEFLADLRERLKSGKYQPQPVRVVEIAGWWGAQVGYPDLPGPSDSAGP